MKVSHIYGLLGTLRPDLNNRAMQRQIPQHSAATGQHLPMRLDRMSSELCWYQCWQHTQKTQGIPAWHGQGNSALMVVHPFRDTRHRQARPVILGVESISWDRARAEPCSSIS